MTTVLLLSSTLAFAPMLRTPLPMQPMMPRLAAAPSMISVVEPFKRTAKFLSGDGVSAETVPCGDDETDECYALCDKEGCTVVAEVRATLQPPTLFSQPLCNLLRSRPFFILPCVHPAYPQVGIIRTLKIGIYFALWFALSTGYNLQNKVRLNLLPLPWCQSAFSLFVGTAFVMPLWLTGLRKAPILSKEAIMTLLPIAFCHSIGHIGAVVSAGAGAVSFTQIVKAAEPVFTCVLSALILGSRVAPLTVLSLVPIVFGVALASVTELSFTWVAFGGAMLSNLAFAIRNICSRASMDKPKGENMTPENLFGVLTVMSFLFALPLALIMEGPKALAVTAGAIATSGPGPILKASVATGLYFYTYNEVAMLALNNVHPVTHAVANTIKRVVILVACVVMFKTPMTPLCTAGSGIAIAGGYLYSLAKGREKAAAKAAADKK